MVTIETKTKNLSLSIPSEIFLVLRETENQVLLISWAC